MLWRASKARPGRVLPAKFIQPSICSEGTKVPSAPGWIHEIKHDGYRMQVHKTGDRVRLYTRRGFDWTDRYPRAAAGVRKLKVETITIDAELVVADAAGVADFARLHSRCADAEAFLYAFDIMELEGADLRQTPLVARKAALSKVLGRKNDGIHLCEHHDADGPAIFEAACRLGLEGIVSKKATSIYRPGPKATSSWIKVKNKRSPAYMRFRDGLDG